MATFAKANIFHLTEVLRNWLDINTKHIQMLLYNVIDFDTIKVESTKKIVSAEIFQ